MPIDGCCWVNPQNLRAITKQLSIAEYGVFCTLYLQYWAHGGWLPTNDDALFALFGPGVTRRDWERTRAAVLPLLSRITEFSTNQDMTFGAH